MPIVTAQFKDAVTGLPIANLPVEVIVKGGCGLLWLTTYASWSNSTQYTTDGNGEINVTTSPLNPQCFETFTFNVLANQYYESESFSKTINGLGSQSAFWVFYVTPKSIASSTPTETLTLSSATQSISRAFSALRGAGWEFIAFIAVVAILIIAIALLISKLGWFNE